MTRNFKSIYGYDPHANTFTPGRVNLIGEHIDYNGGMVLPAALPVGVEISIGSRSDDIISIASTAFEDVITTRFDQEKSGVWSDYVLGAMKFARSEGMIDKGVDLFIHSSVPVGAGLSSSAAVIVGVLKTCRDLTAALQTNQDIAVIARKVENEFIGVPCGIMDQMAVAIVQHGQAIALDTKSLNYEVIKMPDEHHMAIIHSGQERNLADGRYGERKKECDDAGRILGNPDLCLLNKEQLAQVDQLPEAMGARVRHCVNEHQRSINAVHALKENDITTFASLMNASHASLRDDFEVSTDVIDKLVESAAQFGAKGARLTGAGFGGCIVACVANKDLGVWRENIIKAHPHAHYIC